MIVHLAALQQTVALLDMTGRDNGLAIAANDPYNVGPLNDGRERMTFWRVMTRQAHLTAPWNAVLGETDRDSQDAFAIWHAVARLLARQRPVQLVVWDGGTVSEGILLRLACQRFGGDGVEIVHVAVPPHNGVHALVAHPPVALTDALRRARILSAAEVDSLAREFERLAASSELLRVIDDAGRIAPRPVSACDDLLLAACGSEWKVAARVVGEAMGQCHARNPLGDVFFGARLDALRDAGLIEFDGAGGGLRDFRARRS